MIITNPHVNWLVMSVHRQSPSRALLVAALVGATTVGMTRGVAHAQTVDAARHAAVELVMVEQAGCVWCARWNQEIAPIYPRTVEGQTAPLRRIDKHQPVPDELALAGSIIFTPTFILVVGGKEVQRIEGYVGEGFFWGMLTVMLHEAGLAQVAATNDRVAPTEETEVVEMPP